jgi:hypothetical protein
MSFLPVVVLLSIVVDVSCDNVLHDYNNKTHIQWSILINIGYWINQLNLKYEIYYLLSVATWQAYKHI